MTSVRSSVSHGHSVLCISKKNVRCVPVRAITNFVLHEWIRHMSCLVGGIVNNISSACSVRGHKETTSFWQN